MADERPVTPPPARDVVDGIPYRAAHRPLWKYLLIALAFLAWLGILGLLYWWGSP